MVHYMIQRNHGHCCFKETTKNNVTKELHPVRAVKQYVIPI